jgi:hypothetical protein
MNKQDKLFLFGLANYVVFTIWSICWLAIPTPPPETLITFKFILYSVFLIVSIISAMYAMRNISETK